MFNIKSGRSIVTFKLGIFHTCFNYFYLCNRKIQPHIPRYIKKTLFKALVDKELFSAHMIFQGRCGFPLNFGTLAVRMKGYLICHGLEELAIGFALP